VGGGQERVPWQGVAGEERVEERGGRIAYRMKRPLPDGTAHLLFTGLTLLRRLASLVRESASISAPSSRGGAVAYGGEPRLWRDGGGAEEGGHTPLRLGRAAEKDVRPGCVRVLEVWRQA
jgi:hypothetical protein